MSDEELDDLVRRSAEAYPEELPLGNWLRMEEKLQEAATDRLVRRKVMRLFMLEMAILAVLLLLWQGYRIVNMGAEVAQQPTRVVLTTDKKEATANKPLAATQPSKPAAAQANRPLTPTTPKSLAIVTKKAPESALILASAAAAVAPAAPSQLLAPENRRQGTGFYLPLTRGLATQKRRRVIETTDEQPASIATGKTSIPKNEVEQSASRPETGNMPTTNEPLVSTGLAATPTLAPSTSQQAEVAQKPSLTTTIVPTAPVADTMAQKLTLPTPLPDSTQTRRPAQPRPSHRLVVGILVAPSFSAVRRLETARFGNDLGITLEYRLTSRLRVRTGLTRSIKNYGAASSDYTAPAGWQWRPGDYEVNADCRVTEIPLDLRYDVVSRPTYSVFANVGLTSALMRYECYDYDYQVNGQPRTAVAKVYNGANHAFGLLNLSGGVERTLGSRWSVQAEPFLELPLGGVGAGKVRLSSAGAAFSLKYGLLR
jgi:hypothetical protein